MKSFVRYFVAFSLCPAVGFASQETEDRASHYASLAALFTEPKDPELPDKCGLGVIANALANRDNLSPTLRKSLEVVLQRPTLQKNILVDNFRIHFDTTGINAPAMLDAFHQRIPGTAAQFADSVAAIANYVRSSLIGLGYSVAPEDFGEGGGPEYDIYIFELASYGEVVPERQLDNRPDGGRFTTFMRIDNDFNFVFPSSNRGLPALRVTLAHELHHAVQIGSYGFWSSDIYFYEITSTWIEDVLFPEVNDYYQYVRSSFGHFRRPEVSFTTSNLAIEYSRSVWGHFLAKKFGLDAMRLIWEQMRSVGSLVAMDVVLQTHYASGFRSAFAEWGLWNYYTGSRADSVTYYPEAAQYPAIIPTTVEFTPPSRRVTGSLNFLSSRYYDILVQGHRLTLALSNVNLDAAIAHDNRLFPYSYDLNSSKIDESYAGTAAGIFLKLNVADLRNWFSKEIGGVSTMASAFPNPLRADGKSVVHIPISTSSQEIGTISVFSSSMDLVYSSTQVSRFSSALGKQTFHWNGTNTNGSVVSSGMYFYVVQYRDGTRRGKIAVVRK